MPTLEDYGVIPSIVAAPGRVAQGAIQDQAAAAALQTQAMQAREWWRQKKLQSILSKHMTPDGRIDYKSGLAEASAADLLPEYQAAHEANELRTIKNQTEAVKNKLLMSQFGIVPQSLTDETAQMPQMAPPPRDPLAGDTTGFVTPDMTAVQEKAMGAPEAPTKTVSGSKVVAGRPLDASAEDGVVRITATSPQSPAPAERMPEPVMAPLPPPTEKSYWGKAMEQTPQMPGLSAGAAGNLPVMVSSKSAPQLFKTAQEMVARERGIKTADPERINAGLQEILDNRLKGLGAPVVDFENFDKTLANAQEWRNKAEKENADFAKAFPEQFNKYLDQRLAVAANRRAEITQEKDISQSTHPAVSGYIKPEIKAEMNKASAAVKGLKDQLALGITPKDPRWQSHKTAVAKDIMIAYGLPVTEGVMQEVEDLNKDGYDPQKTIKAIEGGIGHAIPSAVSQALMGLGAYNTPEGIRNIATAAGDYARNTYKGQGNGPSKHFDEWFPPMETKRPGMEKGPDGVYRKVKK